MVRNDSPARPRREILFVSCTSGAKEQTLLLPSLQRLGIPSYRFIEHNRAGLPQCYNAVLDELGGTDRIVVFVHSDVVLSDISTLEKIETAMGWFNIVGLVGSAHFDPNLKTTSYAWPVWPREFLSGAVEQPLGNGTTTWLSFGPAPRRCIIMDGVFLAIDMLKIGKVRFDPRFTFHLYDLDFCLAAHQAQLTMGTTNVHIHHASLGDFQAKAYTDAVAAFQRKWTGSGQGSLPSAR